jgi:hypothetical protein
MPQSFVCGEPLCKQPFQTEVRPERPWPVLCPACRRSLYPDEILHSDAFEELDSHRGPLMRVTGGRLTPVLLQELAPSSAGSARSILDEMVAAGGPPSAKPKKTSRALVTAILAVAVLIALGAALLLVRAL